MSTAAKLAASYFNYGASLYYRLMELAGCPGGANTLGICNSLDDEQEYFAARKNDEAVKAERSKERKSEEKKIDKNTAKEGKQYHAGEFGGDKYDEATPARKRKTLSSEMEEEDDDTEHDGPSVQRRRSSRVALPSRRVMESMETGAAFDEDDVDSDLALFFDDEDEYE